jgi:choline dehydrogenase
MFREAEGIEVESTDHERMSELYQRDINRLDNDRYSQNTLFLVPDAINPITGRRSSIADYINSVVADGFPLTLSMHSLATKILFEDRPGKPKANGVEYMLGEALYSVDRRYNASQMGEIRTVRAKKEVIVAGGSFNTPQILQLSGIGPAEELRKWDIPVRVDLPAVVSFL